MRLYSASSEEALRARNLLKNWASHGVLTEAQYKLMEQETVGDLRHTAIVLRIVLFFFTLLITGATAALFLTVFEAWQTSQAAGISIMILSAIAYAAAELAVSRGKLYRRGIEEAFAVWSVGLFCMGLKTALLGRRPNPMIPHGTDFLVPAAGAVLSLWIWHRFGLPYAFLASMTFVIFVPGHWISSESLQHLIIAVIYASALAGVAAIRPRHRFDYLNESYSLVESFLWLGIYLAINLQLSSPNLLEHWLDGTRAATEFSNTFYWTSWVLTWCLPPAIIARGVRLKDRSVMAVGAIVSTLTFVTNKPYLGWRRHTWDPILLGILLIGVALWLRRWLASGPAGIRHGFTAEPLSAQDQHSLDAASSILGFLNPHSITPTPPTAHPGSPFGGGDFGGGGATSDF